jgi:hypothetical protein
MAISPDTSAASDHLVRMRIGRRVLLARLEWRAAPRSCAALLAVLPLRLSLLHSRWSGECGWAPLVDTPIHVERENATSHPRPGQVLLYTGAVSEPEILLPYGAAVFASKDGLLEGNHVLTIVKGAEHLPEIGRALLWRGSRPVTIEAGGA